MGWWDIFKSSIPKTQVVTNYEAAFREGISKRLPLRELKFVVVDTETTGLDVKKDHILAFGGVKVINNRIHVNTSKEHLLYSKKQNISSIKIHEIIQSENALALEDFVEELLPYLGNHVFVAHHAGFDLAMLEKAVRPYGLKKILNPVLDTGDLAIRMEHGIRYDPSRINLKAYSLDALCKRYHIPVDDRHTAAGDAFLTAQLLLKLLKIAENKGVKTFGDLMKW